jgi:hypothetical protein
MRSVNSAIRPDGWSKQYQFVALRYEKTREEITAEETEQYQLVETSQYSIGCW